MDYRPEGVASLYRYVLRKDEVHELMTDAVMADARTTGDWRADLRRFAHLQREVSLRHPWLPALSAGRPTRGPYSLSWTELPLAAFDGTGLGTDDVLLALGTLFSRVMVEGETPHAADRLQRTFESGLDRVLTGLAATIPEDVPDKQP
jgi:hypothetical protein